MHVNVVFVNGPFLVFHSISTTAQIRCWRERNSTCKPSPGGGSGELLLRVVVVVVVVVVVLTGACSCC